MMLLLPWQAIAAAERNLTHVLGDGNGRGAQSVVKHIAEHANHVLHHHGHADGHDEDDDSDNDTGDAPHVDNSQKSFQHLADYEQSGSMNLLLPATYAPGLPAGVRVAPAFRSDAFSDRTTLPLLRPPRAPA